MFRFLRPARRQVLSLWRRPYSQDIGPGLGYKKILDMEKQEQPVPKEEPIKDPVKEEKKRLKELEKQKKLEKLKEKKAKQEAEQKGKEKKEKKEKPKKEEKKEQPARVFGSLEEAIAFKSDLSNMEETYDSRAVEEHWYDWWTKEGFFKAKDGESPEKTYTMVVPPPNVTGQLHIGHGLTGAVEDSIIRRKRMQGYNTCYLPGLDHAGIATQSVVEKMLWKNEGKTKHDLGREEMLKQIWAWKESNGGKILTQFKRLGMSLDWDRLAFTMDAGLSRSVTETFVQLHERGLIYRDNRLVNWSCKLQTAISDVEVDYIDLAKKTWMAVPGHDNKYPFGYIVSFAYKVKDSDEEIVVATTRLETMLGDVAVAVNSKDPRYTHMVGKKLQHPFIPDREVVVLTDDTLVDMEFGTGAVKITPGHDPNDYECGLRHSLPQINILTEEGLINSNGGKYQGMKRFEVRLQMEKDLKEMGLYRGEDKNAMRLGLCSRSKDIIEPILKPQWYVNCQTVKQRMLDCVRNKELNIQPQEFEKNWFYWIENIKDWCISRQIWWGHRCPAYKVAVQGMSLEDEWVIARDTKEALAKVRAKFGADLEESAVSLKQDEDVLDTWFSSALFPFSPFGWPDQSSPALKTFYPNSILETGHDILFFWVARMVMMGFLLTDQLPFKDVFLHPIVRDAQGMKMSKSLGNVIDPLEVIMGCELQQLLDKIQQGNLDPKEMVRSTEEKKKEFPQGIPQCGSDALRFGLLSYMLQPKHINLDLKRVIGYKQFCNKIWNSCKFVLRNFKQDFTFQPQVVESKDLVLVNSWVLDRLNQAAKGVNACFDRYDFGNATIVFHNFFMYDFCDVYIEATKSIFRDEKDQAVVDQTMNVLFHVLQTALCLLHPMMPFVTEELYQKLPAFEGKAKSITIASYPQHNPALDAPLSVEQFELLFQAVKNIRQSIVAVNLPKSVRPDVILKSSSEKEIALFQQQFLIVKELAKLGDMALQGDEKACIMVSCGINTQILVHVKQHIKAEAEIERLEKKLAQNKLQLEELAKKTGVPNYEEKVPQAIRDQNAQKQEALDSEKAKLEESLSIFQSLKE